MNTTQPRERLSDRHMLILAAIAAVLVPAWVVALSLGFALLLNRIFS